MQTRRISTGSSMPKCKCLARVPNRRSSLTHPCDRDAKTPEEQTKQILNIAAVLPGQSPERRFSIPSRKSTADVATGAEAVKQAAGTEHAPASAIPAGKTGSREEKHEDLIDFGQENEQPKTSSSSAPAPPARPQAGMEENVHPDYRNRLPASQSGQQDDLLGGDVPPTQPPKEGEAGHALVPALEKMKLEQRDGGGDGSGNGSGGGGRGTVVGMGKLRRMDSETQDVDEFVDAES
jgi:oxysterol-binding protein-related protein 8